jgi:hypothetical protein
LVALRAAVFLGSLSGKKGAERLPPTMPLLSSEKIPDKSLFGRKSTKVYSFLFSPIVQ